MWVSAISIPLMCLCLILCLTLSWVWCLVIKNDCPRSQILEETFLVLYTFFFAELCTVNYPDCLFYWMDLLFYLQLMSIDVDKNMSMCLCPGLFTVQLMGQQPSHGGAAGGNCHCWISWKAARRPGALGEPGTERGLTLLSVGHLLG